MKMSFIIILIVFTNHSFSNERVISYKYLVKSTKEKTIDTLIFKKYIPGNNEYDRSFHFLYQLENNKEIKNQYESIKFLGIKSANGEIFEVQKLYKGKFKDVYKSAPLLSPLFADIGFFMFDLEFKEKQKIDNSKNYQVEYKFDKSEVDHEQIKILSDKEKEKYFKNLIEKKNFKEKIVNQDLNFGNKSIKRIVDYEVVNSKLITFKEDKIECLIYNAKSKTEEGDFKTTYYYSDKYGFMFIEIDFNDYKLTLELIDYNVETN